MTKNIEIERVNKQKSHKKGIFGFLENTIRKFQLVAYLLCMLPIILLFVFCLGFALTPGFFLMIQAWTFFGTESVFVLSAALAFAAAFGFIFFILGLLFSVALVNFPIMPFVKAYRGPWFSLESLPWFYHNSLFYLVRYTVLDLVTPSPISLAFLRAMGMKIGKGAMVNTSNISDPCLIEIGHHVTIGGSVYMMAHYGMKGFLIIDKLKIEPKANVGLHSYLMGAVEVGEGAQILPNTMVLPKTLIPAHARYGHQPADIIVMDKANANAH